MFKQKLILELTFISLLSWISILEVQAQEYWFSFAKEDGLPSNEVKSITIDSNGNIWAGTYEGIGYFNSITHQWKIYKEGRALYPITVDDSGYVWAGDDITQIDPDWYLSVFQFDIGYEHIYHYPGDKINSIAIDDSSNVWLSVGGFYFQPALWVFNLNKDLWYPIVIYFECCINGEPPLGEDVIIDNKGGVWAAIANLGLVHKLPSDTTWIVYNTENSNFPSNQVGKLHEDKNGGIWLSGYKYSDIHEGPSWISHFDSSEWTLFDTTNTELLKNTTITSIAVDSLNNVWFGTYGKGAYKFDGQNWIIYNTQNSGLLYNYVLDIAVDHQGNVWFVSDSYIPDPETGGISVLTSDSTFLSIDTKNHFKPIVDNKPDILQLYPNYPNPFNEQTVFKFSLLSAAKVKFEIYNTNGQLVRTLMDRFQQPGIHHLVWDRQDDRGKLLPTGVYLYQLTVHSKYGDLKHIGKALYLK